MPFPGILSREFSPVPGGILASTALASRTRPSPPQAGQGVRTKPSPWQAGQGTENRMLAMAACDFPLPPHWVHWWGGSDADEPDAPHGAHGL